MAIHVLFDYQSLVHIIVDASFRCSNGLQYSIVRNTDYAGTNLLQFVCVCLCVCVCVGEGRG